MAKKKRPKKNTLAAAKDMAEKIVDTVRESMLVLDVDLRVVSANQSFYEKFDVAPAETEGRLVYELGNNQWDIPELRRLLEEVLPTNKAFNDYEVEHEFETLGRRVMRLNGRRIDHIQRALLAIEDITEYRMAEARRLFLLELTDAFHAATRPQEVLDQAARRLCQFFRCQHAAYAEVDVEQNQATILSQHAEDAGTLDRKHTLSDFGPKILASLLESEEVVIDDTRDDLRIDQQAYREAFKHLGTRALACTARRRDDGRVVLMAVGYADAHAWKPEEISLIRDVAERTWTALEAARAVQKLNELNQTLEEQVTKRTSMLKLLQEVTRSANEAQTVEQAMRAALEQLSQYNGWQVGHVWRLADDGDQMVSSGVWYTTENAEDAIRRLDQFQETSQSHRFSAGEGLVGTVMQTGQAKWIDDVTQFEKWQRGSAERFGLHAAIAFPITVNGEVAAVMEFFSNQSTRREERFMEIMPDVGMQLGHVIERKRLEKEIADATAEQQRHFGRELHDSVSQQLSGIGMMARTLSESLADAEWPQAELAHRLVDHLRETAKQVSRLSHGLMPVDVDAEGLMAALEQLARRCDEMYQAQCEFQCSRRIDVADNDTATHMYRIAQEAIQNATKHGSPSRIVVKLEQEDGDVILTIEDDGSGIPTDNGPAGAGLRIMQYRANLIGAHLKIDSRPGQGVTVTCRLRAEKEG